MHIKKLPHKGNSIKKLLEYMINGMQNKDTNLMIAHNLPSFGVFEMTKSFLENDTYRQSPAKIRWYHEVLSFSPLDKPTLNGAKLQAIAQQYIEMRNPNALCFAVSHEAEAHTHIHFCFSGVEYRSKKTLRMDNKTFENLRVGMEEWQLQHYPELKHSIVYLGREKKQQKKRGVGARAEREYQAKRRLGNKPTEKERLSGLVAKAYDTSRSMQEFYDCIRQSGVELYERGGKMTGVVGKRKYRFSTLGVSREMLQDLTKFHNRLANFNTLKNTSLSSDRQR